MLEYELKFLVTKNIFFKILKLISNPSLKKTEHINYYFDTTDFFHYKKNTTIRVREKNDTYVLTIKKHFIDNNKKPLSSEYSLDLNQTSFHDMLSGIFIPEIYNFLNEHNISSIIYLGFLKTHRFKLTKSDFIICLDINEYCNHIDYEIELEGKETLLNTFLPLCENYINYKNKYHRFINAFIHNKLQQLS